MDAQACIGRVGGALALLAQWKVDVRAGCERAPQRCERMPGNSLPDAKRSLTMCWWDCAELRPHSRQRSGSEPIVEVAVCVVG